MKSWQEILDVLRKKAGFFGRCNNNTRRFAIGCVNPVRGILGVALVAGYVTAQCV